MNISPVSTVAEVETEVETDALTDAELNCSTISDMTVEVTVISKEYWMINQLKFSTYEDITPVHCGES